MVNPVETTAKANDPLHTLKQQEQIGIHTHAAHAHCFNEECAALQQKYQALRKEHQLLRLTKDDLDAALHKMHQSNSWRATAWCRSLRRILFGTFTFEQNNIKQLVWRFFYLLYKKFPLSYGAKRRAVSWSFMHASFLFRHTDVYQRWSERLLSTTKITVSLVEPVVDEQNIESVISMLALPDCPNPTISVIIPNYGNVPLLLGCLQSIIKNLPFVATEYIVIDDASHDAHVPKLQKIKNLRVMINDENLGFLRNCNKAATHAKGRYLFFLNSDTQVCEGWLDNLYRVFQTHADCGIAGSKLIFADGSLQEAGGILWNDASAWNYGRLDHPEKPQYNYFHETDYCSGAALLVRKDLFDQLRGFDERYAPAYCEDSDLSFSIRALGYKVYYQPTSVVIHLEGKSHGTNLSTGIKAYQAINQKKFYDKWAEVLKEHYFNAEHVFHARDRSNNKPCVLIIDHDVPRPDRDAGSRTMFCLIKLLLAQGYNIKFLPHNLWYDATYTPLLQSMGVEILYDTQKTTVNIHDWLTAFGQYIQSVFLSRPEVASDFIKLIRKHTKAKIIFYGHDLHYARLSAEAEIMGDEGLKKIAENQFKEEEAIWQSVDVICYPSPTEITEVLRIAPNRAVFRLPPYFFDTIIYNADKTVHERRDIIFVAGFAHTPNVDAAEWFVHKIFPLIKDQAPDIRLYLIGSKPTAAVRALASHDIIVTGYVTDAQLTKYYCSAKVAVVPLRYGAGIKNKVLEAISFGVPIVTTTVGAQGLPWLTHVADVTDEVTEFSSAVCALLEEDEHWCTRSKHAAEILGKHFSKENMSNAIQEIFSTGHPVAPDQKHFRGKL